MDINQAKEIKSVVEKIEKYENILADLRDSDLFNLSITGKNTTYPDVYVRHNLSEDLVNIVIMSIQDSLCSLYEWLEVLNVEYKGD